MSFSDDSRTNNARREAAREKAKSLRDAHRKKERRNRRLIVGGIIVGVLVILAVVAWILVRSIAPATAGPQNMRSDGIVITKGYTAERTGATPRNGQPVATPRNSKSSVVTIRVYADYFSPETAKFFAANDAQFTSWLKTGAATIEIHPIALYDRESLGSKYSTRAANAAACVANYSPDQFWQFSKNLLAKQPKQQTAGLSSAQLVSVANGAGASSDQVSDCIDNEKYKAWVADATNRARTGPLPDSNIATVASAPIVIVDGLQYVSSNYGSAADFQAFVVQAAGASFSQSTPTPTPTPTITPTPTSTPKKKHHKG